MTERKENFLIFVHSCHVHDWDEKFFITIIELMMMTVDLVDQNDFRNCNCAGRLPMDFQYSLKCSPKCEEIWQNKAKNQRILSVEKKLSKLWGVFHAFELCVWCEKKIILNVKEIVLIELTIVIKDYGIKCMMWLKCDQIKILWIMQQITDGISLILKWTRFLWQFFSPSYFFSHLNCLWRHSCRA